jgi:DNA-binding transcriptional LysR family regulator
MSVELRQLRYFVAVAEERHFGRAAERLAMSQSGLSQQIKALERSIGVELFIREAGGVRLTRSGDQLLDHARRVLELTDRAVEMARLAGKGKRDVIKVGTRAAGTPPLGRLLLSRFQESRPDIQVEIFLGLAPQCIDAIVRRTLDVAIVVAPFGGPGDLRYLPLDASEMLVALPVGHRLADVDRVTRADLLKERFLDWPRSANPTLFDHLRSMLFGDDAPSTSVEVPDLAESDRLQLVAEGRGVAVTVFPTPADLAGRRIVFRPLEEPAPVVEYGIVWLEPGVSPLLPAFVDLARDISTLAPSGGQA